MAQTHPDRLAALAILHGMSPAPVARCRVLEIGCGNGANLIPMALTLPDSRFTGIDLARTAIETARATAKALAAANCRLEHLDLMDLTPDFGEFDYIIAHGVYSWVPAAVRDKLLAVCRANLAPDGVAYVSYNTYPGCRLREITRDMMRYHTRGIAVPEDKLNSALELVRTMSAAEPAVAALCEELKAVLSREPTVLFHDDLADTNHPVYFHEFVEHARSCGLQFLAEAQFSSMQEAALNPAAAEAVRALAGDDRIRKQQYLDFFKCRRFRQTLLCRAEIRLEDPPDARRVSTLWADCAAQPVSEEEFRAPDGASIRTNLPLAKAAIGHLSRSWPRAVPFEELLTSVPHPAFLQDLLLRTYASGLVELHASPSPFTTEVRECPRAFSLARYHAARGSTIPTLRHSTVAVEDRLARRLIELLDGTRSRQELLRDLQAFAGFSVSAEDLDRNLAKLARLALLEA
ncbi:MAG: methyltransferase regulatory domain-containing protein [Rhodospirillales bacterium]